MLTTHQRDLYAYINTLLVGQTAASDVLQDTNLDLWARLDDFDFKRPFLPWAYAFAYQRVLAFRKTQRRSKLVFSDEIVQLISDTYVEGTAGADQRVGALQTCLDRLPPRQRQLIRDRYALDDVRQCPGGSTWVQCQPDFGEALSNSSSPCQLCGNRDGQRDEVCVMRSEEQQLMELLDCVLDGSATDTERRRFARLVESRHDLTSEFVEQLRMHSLLQWKSDQLNLPVPQKLETRAKFSSFCRMYPLLPSYRRSLLGDRRGVAYRMRNWRVARDPRHAGTVVHRSLRSSPIPRRSGPTIHRHWALQDMSFIRAAWNCCPAPRRCGFTLVQNLRSMARSTSNRK